jgi:hypothetical protein
MLGIAFLELQFSTYQDGPKQQKLLWCCGTINEGLKNQTNRLDLLREHTETAASLGKVSTRNASGRLITDAQLWMPVKSEQR